MTRLGVKWDESAIAPISRLSAPKAIALLRYIQQLVQRYQPNVIEQYGLNVLPGPSSSTNVFYFEKFGLRVAVLIDPVQRLAKVISVEEAADAKSRRYLERRDAALDAAEKEDE